MTKEQEEAILILRRIKMGIKADTQAPNVNVRNVAREKVKAIETILSIIKEQEKLINKLAISISNEDIDKEVCKHIKCVDNEEEMNCAECVKNFFINKIKQEKSSGIDKIQEEN